MELVPHQRQKNSLFFKLVAIAFLIGISLVASFSVLGLVMDRSSRADDARSEIALTWGKAQTVNGPVIAIPVQKTVTTAAGQQATEEHFIFLLPEHLTYNVSQETKALSRGIFDAVVYTSRIAGTGTFHPDEIRLDQTEGIIQWDNAKLFIGISDTRSIDAAAALTWNAQKISFEPGSTAPIIGSSGIHAPISIQRNVKENIFSFELSLRGSQEINFVPLGKTTNISLSSDWPSPSFTGEFLPEEREISDAGFRATWVVSSFGRSIPQSWVDKIAGSYQEAVQNSMQSSTFGVTLHQGVDFYTQVIRAVKYAILFIALTFLSFFLFETLARLRIHALNYLLVGLALALFYLLLLSLSEHIGFLPAYIISTLAISGLITGYARSILKARKRAGIIAALLCALYAYLYILLQLDELSLIFGSLFLFVILATVMYITRHIDWYAMSEGS